MVAINKEVLVSQKQNQNRVRNHINLEPRVVLDDQVRGHAFGSAGSANLFKACGPVFSQMKRADGKMLCSLSIMISFYWGVTESNSFPSGSGSPDS